MTPISNFFSVSCFFFSLYDVHFWMRIIQLFLFVLLRHRIVICFAFSLSSPSRGYILYTDINSGWFSLLVPSILSRSLLCTRTSPLLPSFLHSQLKLTLCCRIRLRYYSLISKFRLFTIFLSLSLSLCLSSFYLTFINILYRSFLLQIYTRIKQHKLSFFCL